ncbi:MAG: c-type cytochrome [Gammaproteobacteria bacterium]|nr:c-type cytochrome [Gammaproteobacteria bacterium]
MTTSVKNEFSVSVLLVIVWLAVVGLIYLFVLSMAKDGFGKNMERVNQQVEAGLQARIKPVMTLEDITAGSSASANTAPVMVITSASASKSADQLYAGACLACHDTGAAGAPKLGDSAAWQSRAAMGVNALVATVVSGKGAMPPNGGSAYSEMELRSVVEYMLNQAGL